MTFLISLFFLFFFAYLILLLILSSRRKKEVATAIFSYPKVSVLVAARNEEGNILHCLKALNGLNYPKEKLEILIGNDGSEDLTAEVIRNYILDKPSFSLVEIEDRLGNARGKANALAHLARRATGDFFFITDADIEVPSCWVQGLLSYHEEGRGIVSGVTVVEGKGIFAKMQSIEWIFAFGMVKIVSDLKIPVTAVGNNMMVSRNAYEATGGYENIPFSVTEDFELFRQTLNKGWGYKNLLNKDVLALSKPIGTVRDLFHQRKRWMSGAWHLPPVLSVCLLLQALFFPIVLTTICLFPVWGVLVWLSKMVLQQVFIAMEMRRLQWSTELLKYFFLFELYSGLFSSALLVYYILPTGVRWKGRKY